MIEKLNSKIRPLLEIYDKLKDVLKIAKIKTPKIATCGMQSHGKSSTLESITKIELPTKAETCTICPIKICLRELKGSNEKQYYSIKIEDEEYDEKDKHLTNFKKLKDKIDEYQNKVRVKCGLKDQNITEKKVIQLDVYKKNVPNLNLYDLPGVTFVKGIKEEAERIYESFLNDEETIVLLVLNGSDDLTNSCVTEFMKNIKNYQNKFIPIVAKADKIQNFEAKYKQLKGMNLNNKPCLIINKNPELNLSDADEVKKIKEIIPNVENFPVSIGRKNLINELIRIQYDQYKENFRDIISNIRKEIKKNKDTLDKLPPDYDLKEDFCDSFIDIFEELLKIFKESIKKYKKGPEGTLLKYEIHEEYKKYIIKSKEIVNEFLTLDYCDYVTNNIKQTNIDKITILEDEIPFKLLITPKIKDILNIFKEIISNINLKIINQIKDDISDSFGKFKNLENKIKDIYEEYTKSQYDKMEKFYKEIYLLETSNITSFDLELNYKCHVLVRKILHFLYKKIELPKDDSNEIKKDENNNNQINTNNENNNNIINENENDNKSMENDDKDNNSVSTSNQTICDCRDDIIKGIKNINKFTIEKFKGLTGEIIDKLYEEVQTNPNFKKDIKKKQKEYRGHIMQIIGIINNYEVEQLTRIYDSIGCNGRPKLSYTPETITTFDERIEDIHIDGKDGYEFIPGFQFIRNQNLNDFINFYKCGKVLPKTANIIVKMVSYAEVMCNRVIDYIFLGIQNYLYDYLTNDQMITYIRNEVHKLLFRMNFEECKRLLEVNRQIAQKIKTCKYNIEKLTSSLKEIENAHKKFYEDDDIKENEQENKEKEEKEKEEKENEEKENEEREKEDQKKEEKNNSEIKNKNNSSDDDEEDN